MSNDGVERIIGKVLRRDVGKTVMRAYVVDEDSAIFYQLAEEGESKRDVLGS